MTPSIKQGADQLFVASLSVDWDSVTQLRCSFTRSSDKSCFLVLEKERFSYADGLVIANLTQEESFLFPINCLVLVQMRAKVNAEWQLSKTSKAVVEEAYDKVVVQ